MVNGKGVFMNTVPILYIPCTDSMNATSWVVICEECKKLLAKSALKNLCVRATRIYFSSSWDPR